MAAAKALSDLAARKRLLQVESEISRFTLATDLQRLTAPVRWVDRFQPFALPAALVGAPLTFLLLRRMLPLIAAGWMPSAGAVFRLVRRLRGVRSRVRHRVKDH